MVKLKTTKNTNCGNDLNKWNSHALPGRGYIIRTTLEKYLAVATKAEHMHAL